MSIGSIHSGDVIEFDGPEGPTTALVLLATEGALVIDLLDDEVPLVVNAADLDGVRVFDPAVELQQAA
jgi:hypothetical protein